MDRKMVCGILLVIIGLVFTSVSIILLHFLKILLIAIMAVKFLAYSALYWQHTCLFR